MVFGVTAGFLDNLKNLGFKYATQAGISVSIDDIRVPEAKVKKIKEAKKKVREIQKQFSSGLLN